MCKKNIILISLLVFLTTSCADSYDSVKRGLTGAKNKSADEFLVEKKDPLVLPPDYDRLPSPDPTEEDIEKISSFEKKLTKSSSFEEEFESETSASAEESILKKIRNK